MLGAVGQLIESKMRFSEKIEKTHFSHDSVGQTDDETNQTSLERETPEFLPLPFFIKDRWARKPVKV